MASGPGIGNYDFLSDCSTAALVSRDGSVDWWRIPRFDEPSVFGRLLGPEAGAWALGPRDEATTTRGYVGAPLGNVPQAFLHVGLINAAWRLAHPSPRLTRTGTA